MIIVADPKKSFHDAVRRRRSGNGLVHVSQLREVEETVRTAKVGEVEAVLLGPDFEPGEALDHARLLRALVPGIGVLLVTPEASPEVLRSALRVGVSDVLDYPFAGEQLEEALDHAQESTRERMRMTSGAAPNLASTGHHRVVTVFSTKGGSGKSFVASNLAILLAQKIGEEVALVDLDLQSGDLAVMLQVAPDWTIHDAANSPDRLDIEALDAYLAIYPPGVRLLSAPREPEQADDVSPTAVKTILEILRRHYAYVVVDGAALFTDQMIAALDATDECVLVASLDVPSLKNLKLALVTLQRLGLSRDRIRVVLNRADSDVGLPLDEVEKALETHIDASIPSHRDVPISINRGQPLAAQRRKRSAVVRALEGLADALHQSSTPDEPTASTSRSWRRKRHEGSEDGALRPTRTHPA